MEHAVKHSILIICNLYNINKYRQKIDFKLGEHFRNECQQGLN